MKKNITICPECQSEDIEIDYSNPLQYLSGSIPNYKCNNCNYRGVLILTAEKKVNKKKSKNLQIPNDYGKFTIKIIWKIASIILIITSIVNFNNKAEFIFFGIFGFILFYFAFIKKSSK